MTKSHRAIWVFAIAAWVAGVAGGSIALWRFAYTPGVSANSAPPVWPAEFAGAKGRPMFVLFAHPRCSCSEATLEELARVQATHRDLNIRIFFFIPRNAPSSWIGTALWQQAHRIPGARVEPDPGGRIASRFGVKTSGDGFLFAGDGRLVFAGGLTASRGHYGYSDGVNAVSSLLDGKTPLRQHTPVYGCALGVSR